jgi:DNA-binding PadR family transcriptional regulator
MLKRRQADILRALASGPLHLRGIAKKTGSLNGLKKELDELERKRCVLMRQTGREHRYRITENGHRHLFRHDQGQAVSFVQSLAALASIIQKLEAPTEKDRQDLDEQLADAILTQDEREKMEKLKRLEAHPANVTLAGFDEVVKAAYLAFCQVHGLNQPRETTLHWKRETTLPEPMWIRVKDGRIEVRSSGILGGKTTHRTET